MSIIRMIILGAPGSGKGTISKRIIRDFKLNHISSGDVLRSHVLQKTKLGVVAESYMSAGKLVPDDLTINLMKTELSSLNKVSWLLDGFPRTLAQAQSLHEQEKVDLVLSLEVPHHVIIDRLKDRWIHPATGRIYNLLYNPPKIAGKDDETGEPLIQREDDKPASVLRRLELYDRTTDPLKDFYRHMNILTEFHGTESDVIYPEVKKYLDKKI